MKLKSWYVPGIPLFYAVLGAVWILVSDNLLPADAVSPQVLTQYQTYKGWGYVLVTAVLLYILLASYDRTVRLALAGERAARHEAQDLVETAVEGVWTLDSAGITTFVNRMMVDLLGQPPEELLGQPLTHFMDDSGPANLGGPAFLASLLERSRAGQRGQFDVRFVRPDGSHRWALLATSPQLDENGAFRGVLAMVTDITARKQAEQALRTSEARFRDLFLNNPHPMWVYDLDTLAFLEVNDVAAARYGYSRQEFLRMTLADIRPEQDVPALLENVAAGRPEVQFSGQWRHRLKDGTIIFVDITSHTLDYTGRRAALVVAQDVTLRRRMELENAELIRQLQHSNQELRLAYEATIAGWSRALDLRDRETEGHTLRVTSLALDLARAVGVAEAELINIQRGALLHDIGKMGVPDAILHKPGPLDEAEWEIMRRHPVYAYEMLSEIAYLRPALDIPYAHHERWDGSGYPRRLAGEQIPLAARIFSIVDVWDALTSDRPYRPAWPPARAWEHIQAEAGRSFDPRMVAAFGGLDPTRFQAL